MADFNAAVVQMLNNYSRKSRQCLGQSHVNRGRQISPGSAEYRMFLFGQMEDNIPRLLVWFLVCFPFQDNLVPLSGMELVGSLIHKAMVTHLAPRGIQISNIFLASVVFFPLHFLHLSLGLKKLPSPPQVVQLTVDVARNPPICVNTSL